MKYLCTSDWWVNSQSRSKISERGVSCLVLFAFLFFISSNIFAQDKKNREKISPQTDISNTRVIDKNAANSSTLDEEKPVNQTKVTTSAASAPKPKYFVVMVVQPADVDEKVDSELALQKRRSFISKMLKRFGTAQNVELNKEGNVFVFGFQDKDEAIRFSNKVGRGHTTFMESPTSLSTRLTKYNVKLSEK
jgi:hypothetical protein